jgi:hypothetical protein
MPADVQQEVVSGLVCRVNCTARRNKLAERNKVAIFTAVP